MNPLYLHDCDKCIFLGSYQDYDLYFCKPAIGPTVIARYQGSEVSLQLGERAAVQQDHPLAEALRRAVNGGLVKS